MAAGRIDRKDRQGKQAIEMKQALEATDSAVSETNILKDKSRHKNKTVDKASNRELDLCRSKPGERGKDEMGTTSHSGWQLPSGLRTIDHAVTIQIPYHLFPFPASTCTLFLPRHRPAHHRCCPLLPLVVPLHLQSLLGTQFGVIDVFVPAPSDTPPQYQLDASHNDAIAPVDCSAMFEAKLASVLKRLTAVEGTKLKSESMNLQ